MVRLLKPCCKYFRGPGRFARSPGFLRTMLPFRRPRGVRHTVSDTERNIEALLSEKRVFEPSAAFVERAIISDRSIYDRAEEDPEGFWAEQAERISWFRRWDEVMERDAPWVKWFTGGTLNASYNCLDRHVEAGGGDKVAYHWEGEPGDTRTITYRDLYEETCRFANALKGLGVRTRRPRGDLPRDGAGAPRRDAGVRADRGAALGGVRRVLGGVAEGPHQRRRGDGPDHRRRRLPPGTDRAAEGERRRGVDASAPRSSTS